MAPLDVGDADALGVEGAQHLDHADLVAGRCRDAQLLAFDVGVAGGEPGEQPAAAGASWSAAVTVTSMRSAPIRALSAAGVPWATVTPWSRTTMSSARRSASSRYCVVRITVVPSATSSRSICHRPSRLRGSSPVVGSSRNSTLRRGDEAGGEVEAPAHPAREVLDQAVAGVGQLEALEQVARPPAGLGAPDAVQPTDQLEVEVGVEQTVDGGLLGGHPDVAADQRRVAHDVVAADGGRALGRRGQRGEHADGRGLAGAVVAEQAEDGAGGDVEVEVAHRPQLAVALAEAGGDDAVVWCAGGEGRLVPPPSTGTPTAAGLLVGCTNVSYMVRTTIVVHCTSCQGATIRPIAVGAATTARPSPTRSSARRRCSTAPTARAEQAAAGWRAKAAQIDSMSERLAALDLWTRPEPATRRPRFTRDEIAQAALRIADAEGFDALSMRRLAAELDAGTMTLYHYVRTKDELLVLLQDAVFAEIIVPPGELPTDWRGALTAIARRSRDALTRHPWTLDIREDPAPGPNGVRHFDQSMQAVSALDVPLADRIELITAVDEYVFGHCLFERQNQAAASASRDRSMIDYVEGLLDSGGYPTLAAIARRPRPRAGAGAISSGRCTVPTASTATSPASSTASRPASTPTR